MYWEFFLSLFWWGVLSDFGLRQFGSIAFCLNLFGQMCHNVCFLRPKDFLNYRLVFILFIRNTIGPCSDIWKAFKQMIEIPQRFNPPVQLLLCVSSSVHSCLPDPPPCGTVGHSSPSADGWAAPPAKWQTERKKKETNWYRMSGFIHDLSKMINDD